LPYIHNLKILDCDIINIKEYKKLLKLRKTLLAFLYIQNTKESKLNNFKKFNVARLVNEFM
jgi:hypothetical protein